MHLATPSCQGCQEGADRLAGLDDGVRPEDAEHRASLAPLTPRPHDGRAPLPSWEWGSTHFWSNLLVELNRFYNLVEVFFKGVGICLQYCRFVANLEQH